MIEEGTKLSLAIFHDILRSTARLSKIIWTEKKWIVIGLSLVLFVLSVVPFLGSGSRGLLINALVKSIGGNTSPFLIPAILFVVAAGIISPVFFIFQNYLSKQLWFFLEGRVEILILKKKAELDIGVHEDPGYTDLFNKIKESGWWRIQNFADRQFFILQNVLEVVVASIILGIANWWILLLLFASTIPELITEARYGKGIWGIHSWKAQERRRFWDLHWHFEHVSNLTELKLFQNTKYFINLIRDIFISFQDEQKKIEKKKVFYELAALGVSQLASIFAVVWFIFAVLKGRFQIGTFTFLLASIVELRQSLSGLFSNLGRQYHDGLFVKDFFSFLDIKPHLKKPVKGIVLSKEKTPDIIFDNVTFTYSGLKEPTLKNFSLKIPAGEKLALVGANGAGKTTLVKLLCRFYDPTEGRILIDGKDLRTIDLESWYTLLGVLFQDYSNYNFVVKDLIALGRTNKPLRFPLVKGAAEASEADLFIREWEKEYEQMIGKQFTDGVEPSIGQWQKLALARAFYRDPRILILDEPTSSIDAEAEAKIFEKLESLPKDHTVILISHRFSTVRQAEKICVIEHGALKEYGTHEALLKLNGIYARLFKLQAKGYR